jgi:hypothetical protein
LAATVRQSRITRADVLTYSRGVVSDTMIKIELPTAGGMKTLQTEQEVTVTN